MPGITIDHAGEVLRSAETTWLNVRGATDRYLAYFDAVDNTHRILEQTFITPDISGGLRSTAYWHLLSVGSAHTDLGGMVTERGLADSQLRSVRAKNQALSAEVERQIRALERGRIELEDLKILAGRPGLPVVYDTNMLNHWHQPGDILWHDVLQSAGEEVLFARLVVPLLVIDELDRQKYGNGDLAKRAATAIRYLERILRSSKPGEPVRLRDKVTLEVWGDRDDRSEDVDLSVIRCAADLANLCGGPGARVVTGDSGMQLRANQMGIKALRLPNSYRKPGTAIGEVSAQEEAAGKN
jgi:rRNA-processing protein FCF1